MKRLKSLKWAFLLAFAFSILGGACGVYADSGYDYYDSLFTDNKFVLYTDIRENFDDFGDLSSFMNYVRTFLSASRQLYYNSEDDWATENVDVEDCDYESKKCQFAVWRQDQNGQSVVQRYRDINIVIDSNIGLLFPMMDGYDLPINYDENMFSSDEEKNNYVNRYLDEYNRESVNYSIETTINEEVNLWKRETLKEGVNIIARKRLDNISFNYIEESYSDIFKLFSSGVLTIRTARSGLVVDNEYLDNYLWMPSNEYLGDYNNSHSDNYWFSRDSNVKDGKVIIRLTRRDENGYLISDEKHLLAIDIVYLPDLYSGEPLDYYDDLFDNGTLYLRTDVRDDLSELSNDDAFTDYVRAFGGFSSHGVYYNSSEDFLSFNLNIDRCDSNSRQCWFSVDRSSHSDGKYTDEYVKYYDGINVVIDSDISGLFPMMSGDDLIVNYEEDLLSTDEEKREYASNYLGSLSDSSVSYYFSNYLENAEYIYRVERIKGGVERIARKRLGRIVFDYTEGPYSDTFKTLTSGTLTIKTDSEIDSYILNAYLMRYNNFSYEGEIKNNKVFIRYTERDENWNEVSSEKHLVTLVKDESIDSDAFGSVGFSGDLAIRAAEPSDKQEYIGSYYNYSSRSIHYDDGSYVYFSVQPYYYYYINPGFVIIVLSKNDSEGNLVDIQIKKAQVDFVGYDDEYSEDYRNYIGDSRTINADYLSLDTISNSFYDSSYYSGSIRALGCNDDYSVCDIMMTNYQSNSSEIHPVAIVLNNEASDEFKRVFNIKDDGSIDIIMDADTIIDSWGFYVYEYDENNNSISFNCDNGGSCKLQFANYADGIFEEHTVAYNAINVGPTNYYSSLVYSAVDVYPGEAEDVWNKISYLQGIFAKDENDYRTSALRCDATKKKCSIAKYNMDNNLEIHNSTITIKDGMSPKFSEMVSDGKIKVNAVYRDDKDYIDDMVGAYFMSKVKAHVYLEDYSDKKAKIVLNSLEAHTMDLEFLEGDPEHGAAVDAVIEKMANNPVISTIDDLEYINFFYYNDGANGIPNNYNSKKMNDILTAIINNKHIGYYLMELGGAGDRFETEWGGKIVLYYDGIAYGEPSTYFAHNLKRVIYIPDDTLNTKEARVAAAQKRIDDYLGEDSGVRISFLEELDDDWMKGLTREYASTELDGNCYRISYRDKEEDVLILKNSSKMQNSTFFASDVNNNINVSSDNANYPTNTVVSSDDNEEILEKYKAVIEKLGLKVAKAIDISLYSPTIGDITNFDGVDFNVSVPIGSEFAGKKLFAFFISDDGEVEMHPVTMDDFLAIFGADHFSTYIIAEVDEAAVIPAEDKEASSETNPSTYDNIATWVVICSANAIGLVGAVVYLNKNR